PGLAGAASLRSHSFSARIVGALFKPCVDLASTEAQMAHDLERARTASLEPPLAERLRRNVEVRRNVLKCHQRRKTPFSWTRSRSSRRSVWALMGTNDEIGEEALTNEPTTNPA